MVRLSALVLIPLVTMAGCSRPPEALVDQAKSHFRSGDWPAAIAACDRQLQLLPDDQTALLIRGRSYIAQEQFDQAVVDLSRLVELDPEDSEPYYHRSIAYQGMGKKDLADADRITARSLDPWRKSAYAYDPGNFIPKSNLSSTASAVDGDGDETDEDATIPRDDMNQIASDEALDEELSEELEDLDEEPLLYDLPSSARRQIRFGPIDNEYVGEAVRDFRKMLREEAKADASQQQTASATGRLKPKIDLDKLAGSEPRQPDKKAGELSEKSEPAGPPISTALPPGYLGRAGNGASPTLTLPNSFGIPGNFGLNQNPNPVIPPGAASVGQPTRPRGGANPYQLHANPLYDNKTKSVKSPLSTSLPANVARPATGAATTGTNLSTSRRAPPLLPPVGAPLGNDRP